MKRLLLAAAALLAVCSVARADVVLTLTQVIGDTIGPQDASHPCIICATNAPHQPAGFGFNNYTETGSISSYNMFSDALASRDHAGDGIQNLAGQAYTTSFLDGELTSLFGHLTFGVAIDINTAHHGETLQSFQLIDLDTVGGPSILAHYTGPTLLGNATQNGNGFADWVLTGFDLDGVNATDRLIFHANWTGASDGGESFFLVAGPAVAAVPEASTWVMMLIGLLGVGLFGFRKQGVRFA